MSTKIDVIYEDAKDFPVVTICNLNQWRRTAMTYSTYNMIAMIYADEDTQNAYDWDQYYQYSDDVVTSLYDLSLSSKGALPAEEMILECTWKGCECEHTNFTQIMTDLGACYQFKTNEKIDRPGIKSGLTLTLNIQQYEYMPGELEGAGLKVSLMSQFIKKAFSLFFTSCNLLMI